MEFTGNASSVATMDLYLSMVGKHPCFNNVQRTKQEVLKATAGKEGWWRFTVEFNVSCPRKAAEEMAKEKEAEAPGDGEKEGVDEKGGENGAKKAGAKKAGAKAIKPGKPDASVGKPEPPTAKEGKLDEGKKPARKMTPPKKSPRSRPDRMEGEHKGGGKLPPPTRPPSAKESDGVPSKPLHIESKTELQNDPRRVKHPMKRSIKNPRSLVPSVPHDRLSKPMGRK